MVKSETTGGRPVNYSTWHRTLPDHCYVMDVDWVETRGPSHIPKGLFETSEINYKFVNSGEDPYLKTLWYVLRRTWLQRGVLLHIASQLKINAYIVIHEAIESPPHFLVLQISNDVNKHDWTNSTFSDIHKVQPILMTEQKYRNFIIQL
jgi:hypothetical protein